MNGLQNDIDSTGTFCTPCTCLRFQTSLRLKFSIRVWMRANVNYVDRVEAVLRIKEEQEVGLTPQHDVPWSLPMLYHNLKKICPLLIFSVFCSATAGPGLVILLFFGHF